MTRITESEIEDYAIKLFENLDYSYFHGNQLERDPTIPELAIQ